VQLHQYVVIRSVRVEKRPPALVIAVSAVLIKVINVQVQSEVADLITKPLIILAVVQELFVVKN